MCEKGNRQTRPNRHEIALAFVILVRIDNPIALKKLDPVLIHVK